jgi:hypothetical protein
MVVIGWWQLHAEVGCEWFKSDSGWAQSDAITL